MLSILFEAGAYWAVGHLGVRRNMYHHAKDGLVPKREASFVMNVAGPFYVADFCIICFTPPEIAPTNIREHYNPDCSVECPRSSCYVGKQPENDEELELMIEAMEASCVRAIRYCGTDPLVIQKLSARGLAEQCDALIAEQTLETN
jgi:hypothetical protein